MQPTLREVFEQSVDRHSDKEALYDVLLGARWSYREWDTEVNRTAEALRRAGVNKGDRVSTVLFNTSEFAHVYFACAKLGAIFNPINFRLTAREIDFIITDAAPKVVIFEQAVQEALALAIKERAAVQYWCIDGDPPEGTESFYHHLNAAEPKRPDVMIDEDDYYAIMYTSGTTGKPKGVLHTHRDVVDQSLLLMASKRLHPQDRGLSVAPMFHCAELHCAFLPRVHMGASNVILHHFEPQETLRTLQDERVTTFFGAPTMWNVMLQHDLSAFDLSLLRQGLYGGAPMAPSLVKSIAESVNVDLIQAYGMTEMGPAITCLFEDEQLDKAGSAGKPLLHHEIRIVRTSEEGSGSPEETVAPGELGEIIVRGPSMMEGYFNRPEATEEVFRDGWYYSGDVGTLDREGYLWVSDRVKDMIVSGGENIYSREVEDTLFEHPAVVDAAVVGEPDEAWGERVTAFVVVNDPSVTEADLEDFCKENDGLADYKRPRRYIFRSELPRNASGKLQKFHLREEVSQQTT
ncbi:fatty-acyl-CoA synthase [Salsuginibacillus halophilus]|uniref:Fatty-acyl-CoA synthase n=1 Tax=Salsuginibacillus halophilus TaxID=517424 RepID=A0A2P8HI22_9BACI|nr:fatty acid--CoA ligase [Salsuginibacillus halophilus]PSL45863.1 fatty-acyl-CoA synthase [Salsuginibacillus halophilus]